MSEVHEGSKKSGIEALEDRVRNDNSLMDFIHDTEVRSILDKVLKMDPGELHSYERAGRSVREPETLMNVHCKKCGHLWTVDRLKSDVARDSDDSLGIFVVCPTCHEPQIVKR